MMVSLALLARTRQNFNNYQKNIVDVFLRSQIAFEQCTFNTLGYFFFQKIALF